MSVELLAVNAVVDRIAACPRLAPDIKSGDKTPMTDGHIDFYRSDKQNNKTLEGRVTVQVKGRVTAARVKASRLTKSFPVEREVLQFFRNHGGGIYFYVPMREGGVEREVFYVNLLPFKIDRLLEGKPAAQKSFSVKMTRLPEEASKIEGAIRLAWSGRIQVSASSGNDHLLRQAEKLTVHSLVGFDENRPTRLALEETDYVIVAHLPGGIEVALDADLDILPHEYTERDLAVPIACGGVEFNNATGRRLDPTTTLVRLSSGLEIRLEADGGTIKTNLNLTREGSFKAQAKNFDFMLAVAAGNPLRIGDELNAQQDGDQSMKGEFESIRKELSLLIELFDEFEIDDEFSTQLELDVDLRRMLLALHQGIVQDRPVQGSSDGTGRFDVSLGNFKIMLIMMPAEDGGFRRIVDPFDPTKRERFRIYRLVDDSAPEIIDWGTVYESVSTEDMATILNLRLSNVVEAYSNLRDRADALAKANLMALRLLAAADIATEGTHRSGLLRGALDLCQWLIAEDPDSLIHQVNRWQTLYRRGELGAEDRREIRVARRNLDVSGIQGRELEACMLILLGEAEELQIVIEEFDDEEMEKIRSWPVWTLAESGRRATAALEQ
ncbi:hypothetical protein [Schumannella soli]|uniref:DUF4365 domain-containing protein n=1 Tax=Schumannella soli TaxID=2590779 RepID=A0A506Y1Q3_9MICO|nr:hypothetical protein [Schumannella soli]TPW76456.1 hypothetical protein FJ657_11870 [Schumannella soli]